MSSMLSRCLDNFKWQWCRVVGHLWRPGVLGGDQCLRCHLWRTGTPAPLT